MPSATDLIEIRRRAQANAQTLRLNHLDLEVIRTERSARPGYSVVYACLDCRTICVGERHSCKCCSDNHQLVGGVRVHTFATDHRRGHEPLGTVDEILTRTPTRPARTS